MSNIYINLVLKLVFERVCSIYSAGNNILAIYCVLIQVWFAASKEGFYIFYN